MHRLLLLVALLLALPALHAQDTGGSFGGGFDDDGGGGGGSSDSGGGGSYDSGGGSYDSGGSSGGSDSSGSSDWSSSDSGSSRPMTKEELKIFLIVCAVATPLVLGGALLNEWWQERRRPPPVVPTLHLVTCQVAVDWRARRELQEKLAALARSGKAGTRDGRAALLGETVLALLRAELSWLYSAWSAADVPKPDAPGRFKAATIDARARFKREVVRGDRDGVKLEAAPTTPPRPADGPGVVVVSLFVATDRKVTTPVPRHGVALKAALTALTTIPPCDLEALEVVWSPAVETDRMSTAELEQLYPELGLLDPESVAGRVFCAHCSGPFAKELMTCPHCGAPVTAS